MYCPSELILNLTIYKGHIPCLVLHVLNVCIGYIRLNNVHHVLLWRPAGRLLLEREFHLTLLVESFAFVCLSRKVGEGVRARRFRLFDHLVEYASLVLEQQVRVSELHDAAVVEDLRGIKKTDCILYTSPAICLIRFR